MSMCDEYLGDFAWLDASCPLDLELKKRQGKKGEKYNISGSYVLNVC